MLEMLMDNIVGFGIAIGLPIAWNLLIMKLTNGFKIFA